MIETADFVVVGAGIVGLALARELRTRHPDCTIVVVEKESEVGLHASGRNSGVLHSGIYYGEGSLKARVCAEGAREMASYCEEHGLPIDRVGKVILPVRADDDSQLDVLFARALRNGASVEMIDERQLAELEPDARTLTGRALLSPRTAVVDARSVLRHLATHLSDQGVRFMLGRGVSEIDPAHAAVRFDNGSLAFGHLYNTAGLYADRIAQRFGVGDAYSILPFKGIYYRLSPSSGLRIRRLIYPVPDLRYPFLGVHFTTAVDGTIYLGPTAIPAFGRENYRGVSGLSARESATIGWRLAQQYLRNRQGFRGFAHAEGRRILKRYFVEAARVLVPAVRSEDLLRSGKVGIRAQLLDRRSGELVMDFVVEQGPRSTHVLNAVSPGFTSAFSFARVILDHTGARNGTQG